MLDAGTKSLGEFTLLLVLAELHQIYQVIFIIFLSFAVINFPVAILFCNITGKTTWETDCSCSWEEENDRSSSSPRLLCYQMTGLLISSYVLCNVAMFLELFIFRSREVDFQIDFKRHTNELKE